jgi:hypothetical protein
MHPNLVLSKASDLGPDHHRNISGVCSACGDVLLARLNNGDEHAGPERLRAELDSVFEQHVAENHTEEAGTSGS